MNTTAFVADRESCIRLREVGLPTPGSGDIQVKAICTGVSVGTESLWLREQLADGRERVCTGYQGIGVVEAVGAEVESFATDDIVAYDGQPQMVLAEGGEAIACCSGAHAAHAVLPAARAVPVPDGLDPVAASLFVMFGTALHGVDRAQPRLDDWVVVHGCGLIGLAVVAVNALHGCRVIAVDRKAARLGIAEELGAAYTLDAAQVDIAAEVKAITGNGAHVVFESTGVPACVPTAVDLCGRHGTFVYQGNYGRNTNVEFGFGLAHWHELRMLHACGPGGNRATEAFFKHLARGVVPWDAVITHRRKADRAEALLDDVLNRRVDDVLGMVVEWQ